MYILRNTHTTRTSNSETSCRLHYTFRVFSHKHWVCPTIECESVGCVFGATSTVDIQAASLDFLHIKLTSQLTQFLVHSYSVYNIYLYSSVRNTSIRIIYWMQYSSSLHTKKQNNSETQYLTFKYHNGFEIAKFCNVWYWMFVRFIFGCDEGYLIKWRWQTIIAFYGQLTDDDPLLVGWFITVAACWSSCWYGIYSNTN